jgi:hypothetical protein
VPGIWKEGARAASPEPKRISLLEFAPNQRNTLRGFSSVEMSIGLQIDDITIHTSKNRAWVGLALSGPRTLW